MLALFYMRDVGMWVFLVSEKDQRKYCQLCIRRLSFWRTRTIIVWCDKGRHSCLLLMLRHSSWNYPTSTYASSASRLYRVVGSATMPISWILCAIFRWYFLWLVSGKRIKHQESPCVPCFWSSLLRYFQWHFCCNELQFASTRTLFFPENHVFLLFFIRKFFFMV